MLKLINKTLGSLKNSVARKSLNVLVLRALGALLQIIVLLVITNNASEVLVGKYNYFNSTIIVLSAIVLLGMNNSFLQFSGKLEAYGQFYKIISLYKRNIILIFSTFLVLIVLYGASVKFKLIPYFLKPEISSLFNNILLALLPFAITMLNVEVLRGLNKLYFSEVIRNIGRYGVFLIFILALLLGNNIDYILEAYMLSFLILAILTTIVIFINLNSIELKNKKGISYKEIIWTSFPMSLSLIALLIMQSFDVYVLEQYFSFKQVAYYGVAIKISAVVGIILTSINATIAPQISKLFFANSFTELKDVVGKATRLNVILTIPLIVFLIVFSGMILGFFGEGYLKVQNALYIILAGQIINALCGPVGLYLNMTGRQSFFQKILAIILVINIILNIILIPKYEMIGAAFSTALSFTLWNLIGLWYVLKKDNINLSIFKLL